MCQKCKIACVVPNTDSGAKLIRACKDLVEHANKELDRNAGPIRFELNGVKVGLDQEKKSNAGSVGAEASDNVVDPEDKVVVVDPEDKDLKKVVAEIEKACDIGIAYGDSLSKWVNANFLKKTFLLMSAADVTNIRDIHLKAYPSAATMGVHFSQLVERSVKCYEDKCCVFFDESEAGRVCCESFKDASGSSMSQKTKILILPYKTDQVDFDVAEWYNEGRRVFCVYGFETSGQGYGNLLRSLVRFRKKEKAEIKILTDVNLPDDLAEDADALICGSTSDSEQYCVGVKFFETLMESLVELIIKTVMWGCRQADGGLDLSGKYLKDEICKNYNCVTTRIGTFSFANGALCVPFYYWFRKDADKLDKPENFRRECDARDSVALATTRIDGLTDEISLKGLCDFEGVCKNIKSRFEMEILKPCFSALKIWFSDDNFNSIDDKLSLRKSLSLINGNSIIQIPLRDKEFKFLVARSLQHLDAGNICHEFSAEDSKGIVTGITALKLDNKARYLYYVPYARTTITGEVKNVSSVVISASVKYRDMELAALKNLVERFFGAIYAVDNQIKINRESVKVAIGSIMSRNGSHNIGSHVLAALSHNVGTMPDDRVLYQYIQHRMDYIATATTDRPTWSQPTMFVGAMIKNFLTQRHLLNYISRSEGLKAWEFQSDRAKFERGGRIKLHVRKVDGNGELIHDFIKYDSLIDSIDLSHDVTLAIPGGVVGQHAFFTIIENVIRNAAKHDWSIPPKSTAKLKELPPKRGKCPPTGDLDVYIDFEDNPEMQDVHFTIWSRLSDVFDNISGDDSQEKSLSPSDIRRFLKANDDVEKLPLHWHQQIELAKSFITEMGDLRRENWGLAEMKISAGYLQKAKIEDIGGINDSDARYRIIVPCCVDDRQANDAELSLEVKHLGYKFNIPKARQILFVVSEKPQSLTLDIETGLLKNGIYVKTKEEISSDTTCNYAYVVMDTFPEDKEIRQMPFRIIAMSKPGECGTNDKKQDSDKSCDVESEDICPVLNHVLNEETSCAGFLEKVIADFKNDTQQIAKELTGAVCECWVRYLMKMRKLPEPMPVYINTVGGTHGSGKTLVTDLDIVEYALNEGIDGALNAFLKIGKDADAARYLVDCLKSLKNGDVNLLIFDRERELALIKELKDAKDVRVQFSREAVIKRQLSAWLVEWRKTNGGGKVDNAINYLNGLSKKVSDIQIKIDELKKSKSSYSQDLYEEELEALLTRKLEAKRSLKSPIVFLVDFLCSYCEQVSGLMSKYAETIATLPECFSKGGREKPWDVEWAGMHFWKDKVPEQEADSTPKLESQIRYWRHETERKAGANGEGIDIYLEGLSGTQSYLNALERFSKDDRFMQARLVENALLRMLIVDERTRDFLEKHPSMFSKFDALGISVANDKKLYVELEELEKNLEVSITKDDFGGGEIEDGLVTLSPKVLYNMRKRYSGRSTSVSPEETIAAVRRKFRDKYEVLVIHQGIIDKWLPGASHNKKMVADFLMRLEKVFRYVVITTGRGTPANIPATARVLPFSTIQTSLFSQYPEKLLLSDAIMNIIPVKGVSDDK